MGRWGIILAPLSNTAFLQQEYTKQTFLFQQTFHVQGEKYNNQTFFVRN